MSTIAGVIQKGEHDDILCGIFGSISSFQRTFLQSKLQYSFRSQVYRHKLCLSFQK